MKRMRIVGLCLVAVFALTAFAASSASALPSGEYGFCVKKTGGKYENSGCTKEKAGALKYEWEPLTAPVGFTSEMTAGTKATLETVGGTKITCTKEHGTGEVANNHEVAAVIAHFEGCETSTFPCQNKGGTSGDINTEPLNGGTGVEKKGTTPPINDKLAGELHGPGGGPLAEFECAGLAIVTTGAVLHPVSSGKMLTSTKEKFTATKGEQKPSNYEGGGEVALASSTNGGTPEEAGQTFAGTVKFAKAVELNPIF
jgi:hypothetical protein